MATITGIDGHIVQYNPSAPWRLWSNTEVYIGIEGKDKHIPNEGDWIVDPINMTLSRVIDVDTVTGISNIEPVTLNFNQQVALDSDLIPNIGSETFRVYVDKSVHPHILTVDCHYRIFGTDASHMVLYKGGGDITDAPKISEIYDEDNLFKSNDIPLESILVDSHRYTSIKMATAAKTSIDLREGEVVTGVVYTDAGHVSAMTRFVVVNTSFIHSVDLVNKVITDISLRTPFMEDGIDRIRRPITIDTDDLFISVLIHYSDGSLQAMPITDERISLHGMDIVSRDGVGVEYPLVLGYTAKANEEIAGGLTHTTGILTKAYNIINYIPNGVHQYRVFVYPEYANVTQGYRLRAWLITGLRDRIIEVTEDVTIANFSGISQAKQNIIVSLNTSSYGDVKIHVEHLEVTLSNVPTSDNSLWDVKSGNYVYTAPIIRYIPGTDTLDVSMGMDLDTWLNTVYVNSNPLYISGVETEAVIPTHFELVTPTEPSSGLIPVTDIDTPIASTASVLSTCTIRFYKVISDLRMHLAISSLVIKR